EAHRASSSSPTTEAAIRQLAETNRRFIGLTATPSSKQSSHTEQHGQYDQQGPKEHARSDADVPGSLITASMLTSPQGRRLQKLISDLTANGMTEEEVLDLFISVAQSLSKSLSASKKKITERSAQDALKEMIKRGGNTS